MLPEHVAKHRRTWGSQRWDGADRTPNPPEYVGKHRAPLTLWELIQAAYREGRSLI